MNAESRTIRDLLGSQSQYIIPLFQRGYVWTQKEWELLWEDLCSVAFDVPFIRTRKITHFVGSIVMVPYDPAPGRISQFFVIDGQQRLTTITVMLMVFRDLAEEFKLDSLAREIHSTYLIHEFRHGDEKYKLFLKDWDRDTYLAFLEKGSTNVDGRKRLVKAYDFFEKQTRALIEQGQSASDVLTTLKDVTTGGLEVVAIRLAPEDNPFEIFASLNFKGVDLTEADLIRNYLFMHVNLDEQDRFARETWDPFAAKLRDLSTYKVDESTFYRHYLQRNGGGFIRRNATYSSFEKEYKQEKPTPTSKVADLAKNLTVYFGLLNPKHFEGGELKAVRSELRLLNSLDVSTCYPLLLNLFNRYRSGSLTLSSLETALRDLNSFVVRRAICGENARSYNKWFVEMIPSPSDPDPVGSVRSALLKMGWPDDSAFRTGLMTFHLWVGRPNAHRQ